MTTESLTLFQAMHRKLGYLTQRQVVLSQNIANADTPNYIPQDIKTPDFNDLIRVDGGRISLKTGLPRLEGVRASATDEQHMRGTFSDKTIPGAGRSKQVYEVAPSGNAVDLEEQMIKASETAMDHAMITNLYRKNVALLQAAIGQGTQA